MRKRAGETYDPATTWLQTIATGTGGNPAAANVQYSGYQYDSVGNLALRADRAPAPNLVEKSQHDKLDRLVSYARYDAAGVNELARTRVNLAYDATGNIKSKSDVGTYYYNPPGPGAVRPHAVAEVRGGVNASYEYADANGNLTAGGGRTLAYTAANLVREAGNASNCQRFGYQGEGQRFTQTIYDRACIGTVAGNEVSRTLYLHPDAANGLALEREIRATQAILRLGQLP